MKIIWTKNSSPVSKLIRWGLREDSSHVVIVFDDKIVFHSNLAGVHIEWFETFKKSNTIVHEIEYKLSLKDEEAVYQEIINKYDKRNYDYAAFLYFGWRVKLNRFFGVEMPKTNKWNQGKSFICVEMLGLLPKNIIQDLNKLPKDMSMVSPTQAYKILTS